MPVERLAVVNLADAACRAGAVAMDVLTPVMSRVEYGLSARADVITSIAVTAKTLIFSMECAVS